MTHTLVPSLPATSYSEIEQLLRALRGVASEVQIDFVDGSFAPFTSWPFTEIDPYVALKNIGSYTNDFALEFDCMICNPEAHLDQFVECGARRIIVHLGSTESYMDVILHARQHAYQLGFALTNDVPLTDLDPYISEIDFVQLMGIEKIGQQGQPFDERTTERVVSLRALYPELEIAVDGAVNKNTIPALKEAGVNRFAPGSAIAKQTDPKAAFLELEALLE